MKNFQKAICTCCSRAKDNTEVQQTTQLLPFDGSFRAVGQSWADSFIQICNSCLGFYQWACDTCIDEGKAILADPAKQKYTFKYPWDTATPFLAYFDKKRTCRKCKSSFIFSKSEQQFWYEELQFVVYSTPVHCKSCRKETRAKKQLNTQLSKLLKDGQPTTLEELEQVAEIYKKMGLIEKWKMYSTFAKKLKRRHCSSPN